MTNIFPPEGKLQLVSEAEAERIIDAAFVGKVPCTIRPHATIMHGAPGSGKTTLAWNTYQDIMMANNPSEIRPIFVAYDEHGALYGIKAYQDGLKDAKTFQQRHDLWDKFRADSQFIRTQVIERAVAGRYDIIADVTSSGGGAGKFIEAFKGQGYETAVYSVYAPLRDTAPRFLGRERPGSPEELITKRIGALEMLPVVAEAADNVYLHYNPAFTESLKHMFGLCSREEPTRTGQIERGFGASIEGYFTHAAMLFDMQTYPTNIYGQPVTDEQGVLLGYNVAHSNGEDTSFVPLSAERVTQLEQASHKAALWIVNSFGTAMKM